MSGRGWMLGAGVLVLGGFAIFLLRETRREPDATPSPPPPAREAPPSRPVGVSPTVAAPPRPAMPPVSSVPGAPQSLPPRSEIPQRPAAPAPPTPEFVRQQKMRGLSMVNGEIRALEREQESAKQAGDESRAQSIGVRLDRLRARKTSLDEELRGSVVP